MSLIIADDHIWLELTYTGGDKYGSHCDKEERKARLVFLCDTNVPGLVRQSTLDVERER